MGPTRRCLYFYRRSVGCFPPPQCQYHCWRRRCLCLRHHRHDAAATASNAAASVVATTDTMPLPLLAQLLPLAPPPPPECHCHFWRWHCLLCRHYRHDATSVLLTPPDTALPLACCWLLFVVCCCLLLSASAVAMSLPTRHLPALLPSTQPPLPVPPPPLRQPSPSGREVVKCCLGERIKKVFVSPNFTGLSLSWACWQLRI